MVVKKLKTADGTPADAAIAGEGDTTVGIAALRESIKIYAP
jgi:hypothetical protein